MSAAANITDHAVVRGDGGAKGIQDSGVIIDDSDNIITPGSIGVGGENPASYLNTQMVVADIGGNAGLTLRSVSSGLGRLLFSDGTTGDETYRGFVSYNHANDSMFFGTAETTWCTIASNGYVGWNNGSPAVRMDVAIDSAENVYGNITAADVNLCLRNKNATDGNFNILCFRDGGGVGIGQIGTVIVTQATHEGSMFFATKVAGGAIIKAIEIDSSQNVVVGVGNLTVNVGNIIGANVTSGADPGHTHSVYSPIAHLHDTQTLQHDGVASDGGAFPFTTSGDVTFNKGVNIGEGLVLQSDKFIVCDTFTSTGINAALTALGAEGGEVYLPEGVYAIDSAIVIPQNNITLRGAGPGTKLDASAWSTDHVIDLNGVDNCRVANLQIEGQDGGGNTKALIGDNGSAASFCILENLYLHDSDYAGIWLVGGASTNNTVKGCTISNCDNMGLYLNNGLHNHIKSNTFGPNNNRGAFTGGGCLYTKWDGNNAYGNTLEGFYIVAGFQSIANNIAWDNNDGFYIAGSGKIVTGNSSNLNAGHGFYLNCSSCAISGNNSVKNGNAHYDYLLSGSKNSFTGNQGESSAGRSDWGLGVSGDRNEIIGNTFAGHDTLGINIVAGATNNQVAWNDLEGELVAKIANAGGPTNTIANAVAGTLSIGTSPDFSSFEPDGTLKFNGAATVWNDLVLPLDFAKVPAANAPDWETFVGNLNAFAYEVNDFQEFTTELLHGYKEGSTFEFHIHGALNAALAGGDETVKFEIEYSIADADLVDGIGDVFPATTTINAELTIPNGTADLTNIFISVGTDATGTFAIGATVKGRVRRIASSGTELVGNIFATQVGVHYEVDTVGSRTQTTK